MLAPGVSLAVWAGGVTNTGSPLLLVLAKIRPASVSSITLGIGLPPWLSRTGPLALFAAFLPWLALSLPTASLKSLTPPLLFSDSSSLATCPDGDPPLSVCLNFDGVPTVVSRMGFGCPFSFPKAGPLAVPTGFLASLTVSRWRCSSLSLTPPSSLSSLLSICLGSVAAFSPWFALASYLPQGIGEGVLTVRCSYMGAFSPRFWPSIASSFCGCVSCGPLAPSRNCAGFYVARGI